MGGTDIRTSIDELMQACDAIEEHHCCTECPLIGNCLKEDSTEDLWNKVSVKTLDRFICFADNIDDILQHLAEEEQRAYEEDRAEREREYRRSCF